MESAKTAPSTKKNDQKLATRKPSRLGRGLSTLMAQPVNITPSPVSVESASPNKAAASSGNDGLVYLSADAIKPNPHQPRQLFNEEALDRLAESIRSDGLMQPIIVRPRRGDPPRSSTPQTEPQADADAYELVAGERRWRAAQIAGLQQLPAIVRQLDDRQLAEWALIENLQREDLNPIERALAFENLFTQFKLSHDQIAQRVGVNRSTVSNLLRLLGLCDFVQRLIRDGLLSSGQAKALASLADPQRQKFVAEQAVARGWSVRQVEEKIRKLTADINPPALAAPKGKSPTTAAHLHDLEQQVGQQLQTKVKIRPGRKKGSGTLSIEFYSLDQFDTLMQKLGVQTDG